MQELNCNATELHWIVMQCRNMLSNCQSDLQLTAVPGQTSKPAKRDQGFYDPRQLCPVLFTVSQSPSTITCPPAPHTHFLTITFKKCIPFPWPSVRVLSLFFTLFFSVRSVYFIFQLYIYIFSVFLISRWSLWWEWLLHTSIFLETRKVYAEWRKRLMVTKHQKVLSYW